MSRKEPGGLFVTGTDTEVGKTYVAARIAEWLVASGRRVGVYKPVASGCAQPPSDHQRLWQAARRPGELERVCPQTFDAPLAPHLAAREQGRVVDGNLLRSGIRYWQEHSDVVLVEGVGGLLSPLTDADYVADLASEFGYPLVVVAPNSLGVINQTLQTLVTAATFRQGLPVAGIVLNDVRDPKSAPSDPSRMTNARELASRCGAPLLAQIGWNATRFAPHVDWWALANQ